jgi:hypothetical protein
MPLLRRSLGLVAGLSLIVAGQSSAVAHSTGLEGAVYRGTCDRLADPLSHPAPFLFGVGERRGNAQAVPAASSYDQISVEFDALLADDHAVMVSDQDGEVLACGEIAGAETEDGGLVIGLRAEEGSGITGIAYLVPLEDTSQTEVTVMVAGESLAEIEKVQAEAADAYANDLVRITESMRESFRTFAKLMETPRFGEEDWTGEVEAQVAVWDSEYEEALALEPPPVYAETHKLLVEALRLYGEAGEQYLNAFNTRDNTVLNQALSTTAEADKSFAQVAAEADRILGERGE